LWRQQASVTDVLQDPLAAVLSARCVLSFQAKMSWVFQLLVRKLEDATSSTAERPRGNAAIRRYDADLQANCREAAAKTAHCHFSEKLA